nr:hypothetical protein [Nostoc sp. EkiNYC01]
MTVLLLKIFPSAKSACSSRNSLASIDYGIILGCTKSFWVADSISQADRRFWDVQCSQLQLRRVYAVG